MGNAFCPPADRDDDVDFDGSARYGDAVAAGRMDNPNEGGDATTPIPTLRDNILRERYDSDPFIFYEALEVLGFGSLGSITRVRKREASVGGSARQHNVDPCAELLNVPVVGRAMRPFLRIAARSSSPRNNSDAGGGGRGRSDSRGKYDLTYALKSIHLSRVRNEAFLDELRNEVAILRTLDHPFIVRAIETFECRRQLYVVMELCSGGDLYSRDPYTEEEAARIVRMLLSAVAYMHERNIVHRDLKYENIMFATPHAQSDIKVIDYGLSKKFGPDEPYLREGVGTIYTMAPQVLQGKYTSACDLWSIGVITYALLSSQIPFCANKRRKLVEMITKGKYNFSGARWRVISNQAKNFVSELLKVDPDERPTAEEARKSMWLHRSCAMSTRLCPGLESAVQASIEQFAQYSKLQKLALMVVAHKSSSEEIGFLRKAFQRYEKGSGVISRSEFWACLAEYGYTKRELDQMFEAVDIDATGFIRYTEFLAATIEVHGAINEERLAEAFDRLDSDDSGYISTENLRSILGEEVPQADIDRIIQEANFKKDGRITYDEFLALWDEDQEHRREEALRAVMSRKMRASSDSLSSLMISSEVSPSDEMAKSNSQQVGLSLEDSVRSGSSAVLSA